MTPRRYGPLAYLPITRRPKLTWPGGARVALWVNPNIELAHHAESAGTESLQTPRWSKGDSNSWSHPETAPPAKPCLIVRRTTARQCSLSRSGRSFQTLAATADQLYVGYGRLYAFSL
jgi:hypothetical protein